MIKHHHNNILCDIVRICVRLLLDVYIVSRYAITGVGLACR